MLWVLVSRTLNEPDGLLNSTSAVGWHVDCAWYFTMCFVKFESTVVIFDSGVVGLEINVWYCFWKCEKLVFAPLLKFSATSHTLSLRHPYSATSDPLVAQRLWMADPRAGRFWVATIPSTVNTAQNIRDFALWYSTGSRPVTLASPRPG